MLYLNNLCVNDRKSRHRMIKKQRRYEHFAATSHMQSPNISTFQYCHLIYKKKKYLDKSRIIRDHADQHFSTVI